MKPFLEYTATDNVDMQPKANVVLSPQQNKVKREPIYNVYVGKRKTGILRRIYKSEINADGETWIYKSIVYTDDFNFHSLDQASASLTKYPPRTGE